MVTSRLVVPALYWPELGAVWPGLKVVLLMMLPFRRWRKQTGTFGCRCDFKLTSDQTTANMKLLPHDGFRQLLDPERIIPLGAPACGVSFTPGLML